MQVKVEEIQDKGLELNEPIPAAVLDEALAASNGFVGKGGSRLHAKLKKLAGRVLLTGSFDANVACPCKRCVKEVQVQLPVKFELTLVAQPKVDSAAGEGEDDGKSPRAGSFRIDEADSEPFDGKTIHLDPIIREQLVLALPVSVLCKDDCKGLCTVCGDDLNEIACGHEQKIGHVGLAKLKDIKLH